MRVAVIFCTWMREEIFSMTLDCMEAQKYKDFDVYIWNNNIYKKPFFDFAKTLHSFKNISITHSPENIGGIGRFRIASKIAHQYDKFIFIDDDQLFPEDTVSKLISAHTEKSICSWWAFNIHGHYWDRSRVINGPADYCGTGGMIIDSEIFRDTEIFNFPEKYHFIEDLWLSFFAKYQHGYSLKGINLRIRTINDTKEQWRKLHKLKNEFYEYLIDRYNVLK